MPLIVRIHDDTWLFDVELAALTQLHDGSLSFPPGLRVATGVGRCLQRIPDEAAWSFVRAEGGDGWTICRLDAASGRVTVIAPPPAPGIQDHCWTADGRLWSTDGTRILEWTKESGGRWESITADVGPEGGGITRMAVSETALVFVAPDSAP